MTTVKRQQLKYILSDFLMLEVGWFVFNVVRYLSLPGLSEVSFLSFYLDPVVQWGQIVVPAGMIGLYALSGTYNRSGTLYRSRLEEMFNTVVVSFVGMLGIFLRCLSMMIFPNGSTTTRYSASFFCVWRFLQGCRATGLQPGRRAR